MENMNLKGIRTEKKMTQAQAAELLGISLRSYKDYENMASKSETLKYRYLCDILSKYNPIDEEHGVLTIEEITETCKEIFDDYPVHYCILFGSYAKGLATGKSDVDLLISLDITGLKFYGLVEKLRIALHKNVDLLDFKQIENNPSLTNEILRDGRRIYVKSEN